MLSDLKNLFWIAASVAEVTAFNQKGTEMLLHNGLSKFLIKSRPTFSNCPESLLRNSPNCIILDSLVFQNFILADEPFPKIFGKFLNLCIS